METGVGKKFWDYAYKVFFNPDYPFSSWFNEQVLGDAYDGYSADFSGEVVALDKEIPQIGQPKELDYRISVSVDVSSKIIHYEFESSYYKFMAYRTFNYDIGKKPAPDLTVDTVESAFAFVGDDIVSISNECIHLPDSVIVYVRPNAHSTDKKRRLTLYINDTEMHVDYPVVDIVTLIPELGAVMNSESDEDFEKAYEALVKKVPDVDVDAMAGDEFRKACAAIRMHKSWTPEGVTDKEVREVAKVVQRTGKTMVQRAEERGISMATERYVAVVMKKLGCSREEALAFLTSDDAEDNEATTTNSTISKMNLQ